MPITISQLLADAGLLAQVLSTTPTLKAPDVHYDIGQPMIKKGLPKIRAALAAGTIDATLEVLSESSNPFLSTRPATAQGGFSDGAAHSVFRVLVRCLDSINRDVEAEDVHIGHDGAAPPNPERVLRTVLRRRQLRKRFLKELIEEHGKCAGVGGEPCALVTRFRASPDELTHDEIEVDHVEPHCISQDDSYENLRPLCLFCHRRKTRYVDAPKILAHKKRKREEEAAEA